MKIVLTPPYLAGLFDAKAGMYLHKRKTHDAVRNRIVLRINLPSEELARAIQRDQGGSVCNVGTLWRWSASDKTAKKILRLVYPYLILRRDRASMLLERKRGTR